MLLECNTEIASSIESERYFEVALVQGGPGLGLPNHSMDIRIRGSIFDIRYSILSNIWRFGPSNIFDGSIFDHRMVR